MNEIYFKTHLGAERFIGFGFGETVHYEYSELRPFVGFASFELEDISLAFAAYEDSCKIQPDVSTLPVGFDHLFAGGGISIEEATGSSVVESHTWDNEEHGESVHEVE